MCVIFCYKKRQKQRRATVYLCARVSEPVSVFERCVCESKSECSGIRAIRASRYDVNADVSVSTFVRVRSAASSVFRFGKLAVCRARLAFTVLQVLPFSV